MTDQSAPRGRRLRRGWSVFVAAGLIAALHAQPAPKIDLYFVAIGNVPADMLDGFVAHFDTKLGVSSKVLTPLGFDNLTFDAQRSQMVADRLIQAVRYRYPTLVKKPQTRIIAVTHYDMYMEGMREQWRFTFSLRSSDERLAVVSYARMDPAKLGDRPDEALLRTRLRKMITKNIGIICFGLPLSENPRSVLFNNVLGVEELDRMTEDFNPK
jgi:predicted Zn-dependent protease